MDDRQSLSTSRAVSMTPEAETQSSTTVDIEMGVRDEDPEICSFATKFTKLIFTVAADQTAPN